LDLCRIRGIIRIADAPRLDEMMSFGKRALIAVATGLSLSAMLFVLSYATRNPLLFFPPAVGFLLCAPALGLHSATKTDYALEALPIKVLIYALVILAFSPLWGRSRASR
jgi:hypothetical protein